MISFPNVSKCAVPLCPNTWHFMGEGKLFVFHVPSHSSSQYQVKKVWLCEGCRESWEVILDQQGQVQLQPWARMAS